MSISIHKGDLTLDCKTWAFPGGEVGVKLDATNLRYRTTVAPYQTIVARLQNSADLMMLIMARDALTRWDPTPINLFLPYIPYARQDRVCVPGEAFSLKVFAGLINDLAFNQVTVLDPHSSVSEAVFDDLNVVTQCQVVQRWDELANRLRRSNTLLVSPDAGANKKTSDLAAYLTHDFFLRADKLRDLSTGKIKETVVYADDLSGLDVAICDDLCDGGASFLPLAAALKAKGASKVLLYVTHAIFSRGTDVLFDGGIDEIWCTNSFRTDIDARVKVLDTNLFLT
jgi:ribose-phosphate pyrophosphokinase